MDNDNQDENISDKILEDIKRGQIKMKPRSYFMLRGVLFFLITIVFFLAAIYLVSFMLFSLRLSGVRPLLGVLPLTLVLVSGLLIVALELCAEQISFVYKWPVVYSLFGILLVVILVSFLVSLTPLHRGLYERYYHPLYRQEIIHRLKENVR